MATPSERLPTEAHDQRRCERQEGEPGWEALLYTPGGDGVEGRVTDLSRQGAGLAVTGVQIDALAPGARLTLTVQAGERRLTRRAEIRWLRVGDDGSVRLGVRFIEPACFDPKTHVLDMDAVRVHPECVLRIPATLAMRKRVLPFVELDGVLHVACTDPDHRPTLRIVERMAKLPVCAWKAEQEPLERAIRRVFGDGRDRLHRLAGPPQNALQDLDADAVDLSDEILFAAYLKQASDVHIDPRREGVVVRFRVDGRLETHAVLPASAHAEIVGRLKVLAGMDIAEKRAPQDGSFSRQFVSGGREIDVRVATLPTKYGERMTLRLLALQTGALTLDRLGLSDFHRDTLETFLRRNQGMMLLTGPTGSGKTTTLYAAIRRLLAERDLNIITVEDPVEYEIDGVAQSEVDSADKVSFAKALRSILRHDPDVVMIGEIRDHETADVAVKASLTGHLVLSTLHTNSAPATLTRLIDMGLEPYLVAASVRLAIAQRLVRRLCRHCRIPRPLTRREAEILQRPELAGREVYEAAGCIYCGGRGYHGRLAVYEMLPISSEWARGIAEGAGEAEVIQWMKDAGIPFLVDDVIDKLLAGETSMGEALGIVLSW